MIYIGVFYFDGPNGADFSSLQKIERNERQDKRKKEKKKAIVAKNGLSAKWIGPKDPLKSYLEGFNGQRQPNVFQKIVRLLTIEKGKKKLLGWAFQRLRASPATLSACPIVPLYAKEQKSQSMHFDELARRIYV